MAPLRFLPVILGAVALAAWVSPAFGAPGCATCTTSAVASVGAVSDQVIVSWEPGATPAQKQAATSAVGARGSVPLDPTTAAGEPTDLVTVGAGTTRATALARLAVAPGVAAVEPNQLLHASGRPAPPPLVNDPLVLDGRQWWAGSAASQPQNAYGIDAIAAWARGVTGSPDVYVGIVDEGVDISHPDLAANVFTNRWDPVDGRDNDHNGYVDDVHGWDFVDGDNTVYDGKEHFDFIDAHGTIVAGEVAAQGGNGQGVAGVGWHVKIIPAKFLGQIDGTAAGAIAALDYLTDLKLRHGLNIVATNNSWEGDNEQSRALQRAIQRGADAGILFVAIAGNGDYETGVGYDIDTTPNYPAALKCHLRTGASCMITVTAFDQQGTKPDFANWGRRTVDLGAPGVGVYSTFPFNDYQAYDGTSQTAPLVAGAIALYASRYPGADPTRIRRALLQSTVPTRSMAGITRTGGRLDVDAMLQREHPRPSD